MFPTIVATIRRAVARMEIRGQAMTLEIPLEITKDITIESWRVEGDKLIILTTLSQKETRIEPPIIDELSCNCR